MNNDADVQEFQAIITRYNLNSFQVDMLMLDCALTGKTVEQVAQQMHHKPATPVEWFTRGREWYLSDGGYSRIWIGSEDGHLFLGGNSLDGVKAAWPQCAALVAEVEALVQAALREAQRIL